MNLDVHLDKLKAFKTIAETGKLREAAERLNLTQPSLTRLIQTLEEATNENLLHRSRQGVVLTEAGQLLYEFALSTLKKLEDLEERLKNPTGEISGLIQVGSYESLAEYLWPEFLPVLKKTYPGLKVALKTNPKVVSESALESGQLDLLVDAEPKLVGDFTSWVLYEDRFNFYGKKDSVPLSLTAHDSTENHTLVYCASACDHEGKYILQHLEEAGYRFKERIELDSFPAVATFAKKGLGIGVLPQRLAASYVNSKQLIPISIKGLSQRGFGVHSICATVHSKSVNDRRVKALVSLLKECFKK